jgi:hypothetical protein
MVAIMPYFHTPRRFAPTCGHHEPETGGRFRRNPHEDGQDALGGLSLMLSPVKRAERLSHLLRVSLGILLSRP